MHAVGIVMAGLSSRDCTTQPPTAPAACRWDADLNNIEAVNHLITDGQSNLTKEFMVLRTTFLKMFGVEKTNTEIMNSQPTYPTSTPAHSWRQSIY